MQNVLPFTVHIRQIPSVGPFIIESEANGQWLGYLEASKIKERDFVAELYGRVENL